MVEFVNREDNECWHNNTEWFRVYKEFALTQHSDY